MNSEFKIKNYYVVYDLNEKKEFRERILDMF